MRMTSLPLMALPLLAATLAANVPQPLPFDNPAYSRTPEQEALIKAAQAEKQRANKQCPDAAQAAHEGVAPSAAKPALSDQPPAIAPAEKRPECSAQGVATSSAPPPASGKNGSITSTSLPEGN